MPTKERQARAKAAAKQPFLVMTAPGEKPDEPMPIKRLIGRPPKWTKPEDLASEVLEYYEWTVRNKKPYLWIGLAVFLGVTKDTLQDYAVKPGFSSVLKIAKLQSEYYLNEYLTSGKPPIGALFLLKNHHGYVDKHEVEHSHTIKMGDFMAKIGATEPNSPPIIEGEAVAVNNSQTAEEAEDN